ncbi:MAG: hypothetical protein EHM28_08340 [Spirochaetaceae bacterium]|nr:MAG: hypothetical protein EHM28_08340 [Spirochaetaceae bacterium]
MGTGNLFGLNRTPEEVIDAFYQGRMMQNTVKLELLARHDQERRFTREGATWLKKFLMSYTVSELKVKNISVAYARVEIKVKSVEDGIIDTIEYWKLEKKDGIWIIINIFFEPDESLRQYLHLGMSLDAFVEKLIELDSGFYTVEVEEEYEDIIGTPLEKAAFFFVNRWKYKGNFRRSIEQLDLHIRNSQASGNRFDYAFGYLIKGLFNNIYGEETGSEWYMNEGIRLVNLSIAIDPDMKYVLYQLYYGESGGAGPSYSPSRTTERRTESRSYGVDKMFSQ